MRILLATAHPHIPQIAGGAQSSAHELAREFAAHGHDVAVLAGLTGEGWLGLRARATLKLTGRATARDDELGYSTYRAWHPWEAAREMVAAFSPDVAFVQSGFPIRMAQAFEAAGVPVAVYFRNVEADDIGGAPRDLRAARFIANSRFTAAACKARHGVDSTVVYPLIQVENYRVESDRSRIVFINPIPEKGVDIALAVAAACPDIPFLFVETWIPSTEQRETLNAALASLPNVTLIPRTRDMRIVYGKARLVLAPSRWEEAFGRVAAEAQVSGIPVIASTRGGLPEAVGEGGVLLDADAPASAWIDAVRRAWSDAGVCRDLSAKALKHAARPELDRDAQVRALIGELQRTIDMRAPAREAAPA